MAVFSTVLRATTATAGLFARWGSSRRFKTWNSTRRNLCSVEVCMNSSDDGKARRASYAPGSLGDLVSRAIKDPQSARKAYAALRSTYCKEVVLDDGPKKRY